MRLAGKVALISGGARGMGAAEAKMFAREGAQVVLGDVLDAEGRAVETEIAAKGGQAAYTRLDVTREADWQAAVALAEHRFGKLDVLVNNAGISATGRVEDTPLAESWRSTPRASSSVPRPPSPPCAAPAAAPS
jgi:NAD(P)-dependent dehydrogenase (short-subunit alcohol dehydrogenase family)